LPFVASGFVFWSLQLRKIGAICALLQRMGIFGAGWEFFLIFSQDNFGAVFGANPDSQCSGRVISDCPRDDLLAVLPVRRLKKTSNGKNTAGDCGRPPISQRRRKG